MDLLKRDIAPITDKGWKELEEQTKHVLDNSLTARKFADVEGPMGIAFAGVSTGRFKTPREDWEKGMNFGVREVLPMVEIRKPFEVDLWEIDNIERGAKDVNLDSLEKAAKAIANFEENIIYKGLPNSGIKGLAKSSQYRAENLPENPENILGFVGKQMNRLRNNAVKGPYTLILEEKYWLELINITDSYPITRQLKDLLGGQIIVNDNINKSFLISERGGDFELTIGQDTAIGYESHTSEKANMYLTESLTFRVLSPEAVVVLNLK